MIVGAEAAETEAVENDDSAGFSVRSEVFTGWTCLAYFFDRQDDGSWRETARVDVSDESDHVCSVAISGDQAIVAVRNSFFGPSAVHFLERRADESWQQTAKFTNFDYYPSVALLDGRAVVGAPAEYPKGAAYIFERASDGLWQQVAKITPNENGAEESFGTSVTLMTDRVLVGVDSYPADDRREAGSAAYVFERQGDGSWRQAARLIPSDRSEDRLTWTTVSLSGSRALIGTNSFDFDSEYLISGAAYVFDRQGDGTWRETAKLVPEVVTAGDFMINVSLSDDRAVVGAHRYTNHSQWGDAAYIFELQADGTWRQSDRLTDDDTVEVIDGYAYEKYIFAASVNIVGDRVTVGAPCDWEKNSSHPGAVYVFEP